MILNLPTCGCASNLLTQCCARCISLLDKLHTAPVVNIAGKTTFLQRPLLQQAFCRLRSPLLQLTPQCSIVSTGSRRCRFRGHCRWQYCVRPDRRRESPQRRLVYPPQLRRWCREEFSFAVDKIGLATLTIQQLAVIVAAHGRDHFSTCQCPNTDLLRTKRPFQGTIIVGDSAE